MIYTRNLHLFTFPVINVYEHIAATEGGGGGRGRGKWEWEWEGELEGEGNPVVNEVQDSDSEEE